MTAGFEHRVVVYRETAAFYYTPIVHWVAASAVELPWLAGMVLASALLLRIHCDPSSSAASTMRASLLHPPLQPYRFYTS